jgi:TetR/AcrR family transcriptional regulator, transcriptional repressor for nem operon
LLGFKNTLDGLNSIEGTAKGRAEYLKKYLSAAHRDAPGFGCTMAGLSSEIRHEPKVRGVFTDRLKAVIEAVATHFPWTSKRSARGDAIRMTASMVGAMILARAVEDERFSDEILSEVRKGLA